MVTDNVSTEDLKRKFYETGILYFSNPIGINNLLKRFDLIETRLETLNGQLSALNKNLTKASESSGTLAKALNKITIAAVVIAFLGVLIGGGSLAFNIYKYRNPEPVSSTTSLE